jgi:hypothetical protein
MVVTVTKLQIRDKMAYLAATWKRKGLSMRVELIHPWQREYTEKYLDKYTVN